MNQSTMTQVGRWTVIKRMAPAPRRKTSCPNFMRARVLVRCVCGHEQPAWVEDLIGGRSNGCISLKCRMRNDSIGEVKRMLDDIAGSDVKSRGMVAKWKAYLDRWQVMAREKETERLRERLRDQLSGDEMALGQDDVSDDEAEEWVEGALGESEAASLPKAARSR